jgi:hypothetical protein
MKRQPQIKSGWRFDLPQKQDPPTVPLYDEGFVQQTV